MRQEVDKRQPRHPRAEAFQSGNHQDLWDRYSGIQTGAALKEDGHNPAIWGGPVAHVAAAEGEEDPGHTILPLAS
jgi:hypothetical protein